MPGPTIIIGVSGSSGIWNPDCGVRMKQAAASPVFNSAK
ncbi:hypothetical protein B4071_2689 [Bacillus subtilis]|nr:hypothetical protein B4071_2689 [Bacillus subtilis]